MLFYILKGKGEGCSLSIITQEWAKGEGNLKATMRKKKMRKEKMVTLT